MLLAATAAAHCWQMAGWLDDITGWRQRKDHFKWSVAFNLHETMQHSVHKFSGHWICGCVYKNLQWQTNSSHESCFYRRNMCACLGQVDKHMHTVIMLGWHVWGQMAGVNKPQTHRRYNCDIAKCREMTWNEVLQTDWCVLFWMLLNLLVSMMIEKNWQPHCDSSPLSLPCLPCPDSDISKRMGGPGIEAFIKGTEAASFQHKKRASVVRW